MRFRRQSRALLRNACDAAAIVAMVCCCSVVACLAQAADVSSEYVWQPVRIGVGGFVVGMTLHPLDPDVRYARTDVGNGYRWDVSTQSWVAMRVFHADGSGVHAGAETAAPSVYGVDSIAVDPRDTHVVYMVFPTAHSCDVVCPTSYVQIYKSVDGGRNFAPGGLETARIMGDPNGDHRQYGERLVVDPANSRVLYYGSDHQGLLRSLDGGGTWSALGKANGLPPDVEFINVQFAVKERVIQTDAAPRSSTVYAVSIRNGSDEGGDVYQSSDGGASWKNISSRTSDPATSTGLAHQAAASSIDSDGSLYVVENPVTNGNHRAFWKFNDGQWSRISLETHGGNAIAQPLTSVAADPSVPARLYVLGLDTGMSRSDDSGRTWTAFGPAVYSNSFGWLPQAVGMTPDGWRSNGGLHFDRKGNLWVPTGQEGILTMSGRVGALGTTAVPPKWTITSAGIEEQVAQDLLLPRGSADTIVAAAEDTTGFVIRDPATYTARQIPLQQEIIAQGTSVDAAPDVPSYIAVTSSNVYTHGPNYSGYSQDGGATWKQFGAALQYACPSHGKCDVPAGIVAVGRRGTRKAGSDHIVLLPPLNFAPEYSRDGGRTWKVSLSFPLAADGLHLDTSGGQYLGFATAEMHQHLLRADPFVEDRFYLKLTHAPAPLYVSNDGGETWAAQARAGLPDGAAHGQLSVNPFVPNDLWYVDGWEGSAVHGIFHSVDGGRSFTAMPGIAHAIVLAIGKSRMGSGDAAYSMYFYGQLSSDARYGIFQTTNGGRSWNRVAKYPLGIYDRPIVLAASPDTFGRVVIGWEGNSFAYSLYVTKSPAVSK